MRVYSVCEYCQEVYDSYQVEGPDGLVELKGVCPTCQGELKSYEEASLNNYYPRYH